jgi:sulfoxide reductase catalytic subunit YedY
MWHPLLRRTRITSRARTDFPLWVRYCHFFNFLFVMMLIRSGLSILADQPRLYFNDNCTPGSEWIRFTPIKVPRDRLWTAKDDARYLSPLVGTPGYRHTIGIARVWHFIDAQGFIATGIIFIAMLLSTEQWRRIVPASHVVSGASVECLGSLRHVALASRAERLLWL